MSAKKTGRLPDPIDLGKYIASTIYYLHHQLKKYQSAVSQNDLENYDLYCPKAIRYACGHPIPRFQRELCWEQAAQRRFIESLWYGLPVGTYTVCESDYHEQDSGRPAYRSGWVIDGQQRLTAIEAYLTDQLAVFDLYYSDLTSAEQRMFLNKGFARYETTLNEDQKIVDLYELMAIGGKHLTDKDIAHARRFIDRENS